MDRWLRWPLFIMKQTRLMTYSNDSSNKSCEPWPGNEQRPTRQAIERQRMCIVVHVSSFPTWEKHKDVYVERLSATNAHKSENFRTAHWWLRNDSYIEWWSAINALIRVNIFKLSAIWDRITWDWTWRGSFYTWTQLTSCNYVKSLHSVCTSPEHLFTLNLCTFNVLEQLQGKHS